MWDRLFGRGKQELSAEPTCAACGRTLLPGEWAQTIVREDGVEEVVCSLCAQARDYDSPAREHDATTDDFAEAVGYAPATPAAESSVERIAVTGRPQHSRGRLPQDDSDSFWRALKEKDTEIARLQAEIVRLEVHNRQLSDQLTQSATGWAAASAVAVVEPGPDAAQWTAEQQWAPEPAAAEQPAQWATGPVVAEQPAQWATEPVVAEAAQWAEQPEQPPATDAGLWTEQPQATDAGLFAEQPEQSISGPTGWSDEQPAQWATEPVVAEAAQWAEQPEQPVTEAAEWAARQPTQSAAEPVAAEAAEWAAGQPGEAAEWAAGQPGEAAAEAGEQTAEWSTIPPAPEAAPSGDAALATSAAAAAVTDEWTGRSQLQTTPTNEWPSAAPLEAAGFAAAAAQTAQPFAPLDADAVAFGADTPERPAIIDTPTEPLDMYEGAATDAASDYCPACDTDEMPAVAPVAAFDEGDATVQIPAALAAQQIVFEPQPEPADLHLLERGADLFNVSPMPQKVAESNELLGLPAVHLSSQGDVITALFLWSMAWYEYRIDLKSGDVVLAERGYDDRGIDRPNGTTKPDGTVQLAPLPARRAVVQPAPLPEPAPSMPPTPPVEAPIADGPQPIVPGKGDIISKSLKGQRTDDEGVAWDEMAARDFDWGR